MEVLEVSLLSVLTQKYNIEGYDQNEWLNDYVINENPEHKILISDNIFSVNGWGFLVDRSVPKILENLGKIEEDIGMPKIASIEILDGNKLENEWYTSDIKIRIKGTGYTINGQDDIKLASGRREIIINEDGIYEIKAYVENEDGTKSEKIITIKRDTNEPEAFTPIDGIGNGTGKQIQINTKAKDTSGISEYRYYLNNEYIATTKNETYTIIGLEPFIEYELYVIAKDNVGKEKQSEKIKFNTGIYLYKNGDECINVTGGWRVIYKSSNKTVKRATTNCVGFYKDPNGLIDFSINGAGITTAYTALCTGGAVGISNRITIDNYKYMYTNIAVGLHEYNGTASCGMVMESDNTFLAPLETTKDFGLIAYSKGTDTPKTFVWDISHLKGEYSPSIYVQAGDYKLSWTNIYQVWLLK